MGKRFSTAIIIVLALCVSTIAIPMGLARAEDEVAQDEPVLVLEETVPAEEGLSDADEFAPEQVDEISTDADTPKEVQDNNGDAEMTDDEYIAYLAANDLANSPRFVNGVPVSASSAPSTRVRLTARSTKAPAWSYTDEGWVNTEGTVVQGATAKGIDVSEWNGQIDWTRVKEDGISFAILRIGYSTYEDEAFEYNASECERLGIPYGVYVYSYARNAEQGAKEADAVIGYLSGHTPSYPVYIDIEDTNAQGNLTADDFAALATAFCTRIELAGYEPGVYSMLSWWDNYFTSSVFDNWSKWIAQLYTECEYDGPFRLWQCSWTGSVDGISGDVDLNLEFGGGEVVKPEGLAANNASGSYAHPIADGEYNILSAMSSAKVIDTYGNATYAGANIQLWTYTNGGGDRFRLSADSHGLYTILNVNSGKALSLSGNSGVYGQNVVQMDPTGMLAQKWIIEQSGTGYVIRSAFNTDYVLDVERASTEDGSNIGIWTVNGGANQRWTFRSLAYPAQQTVSNGSYYIACSGNENVVLDVSNKSTEAGANVGFWTLNNGKNQQFEITHVSDGYYLISGVQSGMAVDVSSASKRTGSNLLQWTVSKNDNQLWAIVANDDGSYSFVGKGSGLLLTAAGGSTSGANAAIGPMDYAANQRFTLKRVDGLPVNDPNRPIDDGTYVIESSMLTGLVLDVTSKSTADNANIETWTSNGGTNQQWVVTWDAAVGAYSIMSTGSGKYLDAAKARAADGTNIIQWTGNNGKNQRWRIVADGDGYRICSVMDSSFVVDIANKSTTPGANVGLWSANGGANQRFKFIPVSGLSSDITPAMTTGRVLSNGMYEIAVASNPTLVMDVANKLTSDRANVCVWTDNDGLNQRFTLMWDASANAYMITCVHSGSVIDLAGSQAVVGANIQQYHSVGSYPDQRWIVTKTSAGYLIASAVNPNYYICLDGVPKAGSNVQLGSGLSSATTFTIKAV